MRRIDLPGLGVETSVLGFGCASLGSRIAPGPGVRALEAAYDAGVRWFDFAPAYGGGLAEGIAAGFLRARRGELQICTKVGLLPPARGALIRALLPVARTAVRMLTPLRAALRQGGAGRNRPVALSPELLATSLDASLRRFGTEYVDVYALHNADPVDIARDDVLRALEDILASGKARAVAVAGSVAAAQAAIRQGPPFTLVQIAQPADAVSRALIGRAQAAGTGCITHSVFGVDGDFAQLRDRLRRDGSARAVLAGKGYGDKPDSAAAALLISRAWQINPKGVVLASMFSARSLALNTRLASAPLLAGADALCRELL